MTPNLCSVLPSIYIGHHECAANLPLLHSAQISGILIIKSSPILSTSFTPYFPNAFIYRILDLHQSSTSSLIGLISEIKSFIESIIDNQRGSVFVYDDVSGLQAAELMALYATDKYQWPFKRSVMHIQHSCPDVQLPQHSFNQGLEFEAICRARDEIKWQQSETQQMEIDRPQKIRRMREDGDYDDKSNANTRPRTK